MRAPDGRPMIQPQTRTALREWLTEHHDRSRGTWLATYKKATGMRRLEYAEIVEEVLCFGWIDLKPNALDETRSLLWISPRRPSSGWSRLNKQRISKLEAAGRMTDAGRAAVSAAKASGAWDALDAVEALEIPPDLDLALRANEAAAGYFEAFPPSSKKIILTWIASAKRPETRQRRIHETVTLAAANIRANHYRQPRHS